MTVKQLGLANIWKSHSVNNNAYDQKHDWDAEKKQYDFHINSLLICIKYVTRYVTTQAICLRLITFNPLILGAATK